jgi:hypothetical protein
LFLTAAWHCVFQWEQWRDVNLENELQLVIDMIGAVRRLKTKHSIKDKPEGETHKQQFHLDFITTV